MSSAPAGWYPEPDDPTQQRYWDGAAWTDHQAPINPVPVAPTPSPVSPSHGGHGASSGGGGWGKAIGFGVGGLAVGLVIGTGVGAMGASQSGDDSASPEPAVTVTVTAGSSASEAPSATATPTQGAEPVTLSLKGDGNTPPFTLAAGDYKARWSTGGDCTYYVTLEPTGFGSGDVFSADSATSGTQYLYGLRAGKYHLNAITGPAPGCPWKVTLSAQ